MAWVCRHDGHGVNRLADHAGLVGQLARLGLVLPGHAALLHAARAFVHDFARRHRFSARPLGIRAIEEVHEKRRSALRRFRFAALQSAAGRALILASGQSQQTAILNRLRIDDPDEFERFRARLEAEHEGGQSYRANKADWLDGRWSGLKAARDSDDPRRGNTGVDVKILREIGQKITAVPKDFHVHRTIQRFIDNRRKAIESGEGGRARGTGRERAWKS